MKTVDYAVSVLIAAILFGAQGIAQSAKRSAVAKEVNMCAAMEREFSKGCLGLINEHLYIVVKSASNGSNELIVDSPDGKEQRWKGKSITKPEIVIVYEGRVYGDGGWFSQDVPDQFELSKSVVISFEKSKIYFFDYQTMSGGYYERLPK